MIKAGLRDSNLKLVINEPQDIPVQGNYIRVSEAVYQVIVEINDSDIFVLEPGQDVVYPVDQEFKRARITTLGPSDTVRLTVGKNVRVSSAKISGQVTISNPAFNISGGTITEITNTVKVDEQGFTYGASWKSSTAQGAGGVDTIIAPGANLNGVIVLAASFTAFTAAALPKPAMLSKASMPASNIDGDVILMPSWGSGFAANGVLMRAVRIPAGRGLYYTNSVTEDHGLRSVLYKLL